MNRETRLKERILELEKAYKTLELTDKQKTEYFIHLAHEIKTPLTFIKNYLEKYIHKTGINDDLRIIKQNMDILLRDITNYLDLDKLNRGQTYYDHEQITNISALLMNKLPVFKALADKKKISIDAEIQPGLYIKVDPFAADRIINNLFDNAIKYTNNGGRIAVHIYRYQGNLILKVSDNGIGMTLEQRKNIFLPYTQALNKNRNIQGMGIGLCIVKKIIESLGADIRVESKINKGTTFTIIIKKERVSSGIKNFNSSDFSIPIDRYEITGTLRDENINPNKHNVLVIDDNKQMLYFLQSFLKDKYNIYLATNGKEALEKIIDIPKPDAVIADVMMDEMDGHSFLMHLYNIDEFMDVPILFLTAKSTLSEKIKGLSGGAIDYIYKPFNIEELDAKIQSIIRNRQACKKYTILKIEQILLNKLRNDINPDQTRNRKNSFQDICRRKKLSTREIEVMICVKEGLLNKEISSRLNISISTVEYHLRNIYHKFSVQNRVELLNQLNAEGLN
ncbi:MAG: response regulator [Spirochaetales bacterium]|nr:response regulator [Spirochaetales bacterium]